MNQKADANMWWIIIGAVVALVVLIVLMVIFTGKVNPLERGLLDCESKGGKCLSETECRAPDVRGKVGTISSAFECTGSRTNPGGVCCFRESSS